MNTCRLCGQSVSPFLNLGRVPLPEELRSRAARNTKVTLYPLGLSSCSSCHHVQLTLPVSPNPIYKKNYFYDYSVTKTGNAHWKSLAYTIIKSYRLTPRDLVIDVGSNTGTLLTEFAKKHIRILGVDPASKLATIARDNGIPTQIDYFTPRIARSIVSKHGQATIITTTNVFDHVENLHEFMDAVKILLHVYGSFIIEVPYFYPMLKDLTHVVYPQQIDYMMVTPLIPFFRRYRMEIVDAREIPLHGGSIRLVIRNIGMQKPTSTVSTLVSREQKLFKIYPRLLKKFANTTYKIRDDLAVRVQHIKTSGKRIAAVGASAKGITLLNYAGLGSKEIDFITEKSPLKIGRFTPSGIPVVTDSVLLERQPDYAILLAWNFQNEVITNLKRFKGTWIIPVPKVIFYKPS